jgi:hypothetical protein
MRNSPEWLFYKRVIEVTKARFGHEISIDMESEIPYLMMNKLTFGEARQYLEHVYRERRQVRYQRIRKVELDQELLPTSGVKTPTEIPIFNKFERIVFDHPLKPKPSGYINKTEHQIIAENGLKVKRHIICHRMVARILDNSGTSTPGFKRFYNRKPIDGIPYEKWMCQENPHMEFVKRRWDCENYFSLYPDGTPIGSVSVKHPTFMVTLGNVYW